MLSKVLNPIFCPILRPIGTYLHAETDNNTNLANLKTKLKDKIDKIDQVNNPTLHKQLSQLQKDINALDLTRNCLPFQEDREDAENLAKGIITLVDNALLLLSDEDGLINLPPTHEKYQVVDKATAKNIRAQCNKILSEVAPLKLLSEKSPILWKDEAWKNLLFFVAATVLVALGCSTAPVFIGGGALWLIYYAQLNYRKDIFDNAAKLLNRVTTETLKINQTITELRAETADAEAKSAKIESQLAVKTTNAMMEVCTALEKRLEYLETVEKKYAGLKGSLEYLEKRCATFERSLEYLETWEKKYVALEKQLEHAESEEEITSSSRRIAILENIENKYQLHLTHPNKLKVD